MSDARAMTATAGPLGAVPHAHGTTFRVWAPHADAVFVVGSFNDWAEDAAPMTRQTGGIWQADLAGARPGDEYRYLIVNGEQRLTKIDPFAREVTNSVGNGIIVDPAHDWHGDAFTMPPWNELVIYEMHIGTFHRVDPDEPGTFADAIQKLDHLRRLGVNALQIMPAMEFAGDISWGYNPAHIFAVESAYGGPHAFMDFVAAAHRAGFAVLLDVVYNHFGPSDLDLWQFDGWSANGKGGIYFYNDWRGETPWGDTRPDYGRHEVRDFIRTNALYWLDEYHLDGLRFDMTLYIRNVRGHEHDPGDSLADGWGLMRWINDDIRQRFPGRITIAEDLRSNAAITRDDGAGFGAQWCAQFVHPVREVLLKQRDEERHMATLAHALRHHYNGDPFERVIYTESHDEVANGKARIPHEIAPNDPDHWAAQKRSTLGAALTLTAPGIPMLFQGQEFLEGGWFRDTVPLDWDEAEDFRGITRLYRDMVRLRLNKAGKTRGLAGRGLNVHRIDESAKLIAYHRWDVGGPGDDVVVVLNLGHRPIPAYRLGFPRGGQWRLRLNTDWRGYSDDFGDFASHDVEATEGGYDGLRFSAELAIGPYSALVFSQDA
jgi:1,4-alpha-glucan branching enzyme